MRNFSFGTDQCGEIVKSFLRFPILDDERGGVTPLMLVLFIGIILMTGLALDLIRHESERSDLQDALDRGVLAAASLTQRVEPELTVREYLGNRSLSDRDLALSIGVDSEIGYRHVVAGAEYRMDTIFLRMAGLLDLKVPAVSGALQGRQPVEISLVLDISGTMRFHNRIINLKPAARTFIEMVTDGGENRVSTVNLIPYSGQVNPGPRVFNLIGGNRDHDYSSCPELTAGDFSHTGLPAAGSYEQVPNFHHWWIDQNWMDWGWCPTDGTAITYMANDAAALQNAIDGIRLHDGTGTYNAMKWALALLDPGSQPMIAALAELGDVDAAYTDRPAAWDDPETRKFIVLMTDGIITRQVRPDEPDDPALATEEVLVYNHPYSQTVPRGTGLNYFYGLCDMAKARGVTVFTIAFEAPEGAKTEMKRCASSLGHFYDVEGLEIESAFRQIANAISNLKLVL
jgi:hypothetical protein